MIGSCELCVVSCEVELPEGEVVVITFIFDRGFCARQAWRVGRISCGGSAAFSGAGVPAILGRPGEAVESHVPEAGRGGPPSWLSRSSVSRRGLAPTPLPPSSICALPTSTRH